MTSAYDPKSSEYFGHARTEIEPLLPPHSARILEIGCGTGATLQWLKAMGRCDRTIGIELVERAATMARAHVDRVVHADAETGLDAVLHDGPFDVVLCLDVLEHMRNPWGFLSTLAKVIPSGTLVIASVPNVRHYRVSMPLLFLGRWRYEDAGVLDRTHLRFFTREGVRDLFTGDAFNLVELQGSQPPTGSGSWWVDRMTFGIASDVFSVQYLVSVRRR